MAKRKEYLNEAERAMLGIFAAYYKEHGVFPNDSVIKRACTSARNSVGYDINMMTMNKLAKKYKYITQAMHDPDWNNALAETIKDIEDDVQGFWLRLKHS